MGQTELKCCVSGSYSKYWPEIRQTIKEFQDGGVQVLEPSGNWVFAPFKSGFRELDNEFALTPKQIEDGYFDAIGKSNFLYVDNHDGHFGDSASLEIGYAVAKKLPVFMRNELSISIEIHPDLLDYVKTASPTEVIKLLNAGE